MIETATLLLTDPSRDLAASLEQARPDLMVMELEEWAPPKGFRGPLWAFVDWLPARASGLEICRRLRESENTRHAHVTMVLENADTDARRRALAAGADDYLIGPLNPDKVLERIGGAPREQQPRPPAPRGNGSRLQHGDLTIDLAAYQARYRGRVLPLRPNEFRLLVHFVENPDQLFTRTGLIDRLGKDAEVIDERTVDVWIGRLRRGLKAQGVPDPLRTVRSMGYVLDSLAL